MPDRLPPFTALRAFEAAARHLSFARAAEELHVTPAALSYQIKTLEAHLGAPVFRRLNRAVELTELGRSLQPGIADAFGRMQAAWGAALRAVDQRHLVVTAGPAFTSEWLAPRMFRFALDHPEIELRFAASLKIMDFDRDGVDVAIRFGVGSDEGLFSEPLFRDWHTPMLVPELAEKVKEPRDLLALPLIHSQDLDFVTPLPDWAAWFRAAGVAAEVPHGPTFSHVNHAIDYAMSGGGAVLGRGAIAERKLKDGRLVAPFELAITSGAAFRLVCPSGTEERPAIRAFRDWIRAEMRALDDLDRRVRIVHI